jgi:hypothetical protein
VSVFTKLYKEPRENPNGKDKKDRHNRVISTHGANTMKKDHIIQIQENGEWKTISRYPITYLQAVRLLVQDRILKRFHERNEARIVKV